MKQINFTKFKLFPIWNFTVDSSINQSTKTIKIKKEDKENIFTYKELSNKYLFMLIKYIPTFILFLMITKYELLNMQTSILSAFVVTSLGLLVNLKYDDKLSSIVAIFWLMLLAFIFDIKSIPFIFKYSLVFYFIYQFIFDLNRKYYEIYDKEQNLVSYAFIKRDKI